MAAPSPELCFPEKPETYMTPNETTIAHIARPVIEYLHANPVDAVVAADRGGRLLALAMHHSWGLRYPDDRFPSNGGRIHFVRNSRKIDADTVSAAIDRTLDAAFIGCKTKPSNRSILFVDDWVMNGTTFVRFAETARRQGISRKNMHAATMNGTHLKHTSYLSELGKLAENHIIGDPDSSGSAWDGDDHKLGLTYEATDGVTPLSFSTPKSRDVRKAMYGAIEEYYAPYTEAITLRNKAVAAQQAKDTAPNRREVGGRILLHREVTNDK